MQGRNLHPRNDKGQPHGYHQQYLDDGQLYYKGAYVDGRQHGPWYINNTHLSKELKGNFIHGTQFGLWLLYDKITVKIFRTYHAK